MVTITHDSLTTLVHDSAITAADAEALIDHAVNQINLYGKNLDLPNMVGVAGTKTLSCDSREAAAILAVAVVVYSQNYKQSGSQSGSFGIGPLSLSSSSSGSGTSSIENLAKDMADYLMELDITVG
jgi:hypothetical protein